MARSIKICFVHGNGYAVFNRASGGPIGGVEVQFGLLARWLAARSWDVSYVVANWGQPKKERRERMNFICSYSPRRNLVNIALAPWRLWEALRLSGAEVYIMSSAGPEIALVSWFCRLYGKKLIYLTAHDIDCDGAYRKSNPIKGMMFEFGLKQANLLIAQKEEHSKTLKPYFGLGSIVIRSAWPLVAVGSGKRDFVLWVARCEAWKNPLLFIEVAKRLPDRRFVMICPPKRDALFMTVRKQTKGLNNLKLVEGVVFEDLQPYFNRARVFVSTSDSEGFPMTFLQAGGSGVPIVSYKVNPGQFITDNEVGYFADGKFNRLVDCVDKLFRNEDNWREKSDRAREYVRKNHATDTVGRQWEEVIGKVANEK